MTPLAAAANENLAQISNYLVYSSMAVYMLAFFAHIAEWTFGSRSKVARTAAARTPAKGAAAPAAPAVKVRGKAGSTAVLDARACAGSKSDTAPHLGWAIWQGWCMRSPMNNADCPSDSSRTLTWCGVWPGV